MGILVTIASAMFGWIGDQTFKNTVDKEKLYILLKTQVSLTEDIKKSLDNLNKTVLEVSKSVHAHDLRLLRLEEHNHAK